MKRLHVHLGVADLETSIRFYSSLCAAAPTVVKDDYAKWMLDDPRVNFAISTRSGKTGLDHLGIQAENAAELAEMNQRLDAAQLPKQSQMGTTCCYARSDKHWTLDPQGIAWESYHTLDSVPTFGANEAANSACCAPAPNLAAIEFAPFKATPK